MRWEAMGFDTQYGMAPAQIGQKRWASQRKQSSRGFHHPELNEAGDPTKPLHKPGDPPEGGRFPHFGKVWRSKAYFRKVWRSNPLLPK